jgi:membrane protein DedA with SNARE-associated domain
LQGAVVAIFPEEVVIGALGFFWHQGRVSFLEGMIAVQLGLLPANLVLVLAGRYLGTRFLSRTPFGRFLRPDLIERALSRLKARGSWAVVLTRFTPLVRGPMYFAIGLSKTPLKRFCAVDALASCVQIPMLLIIGSKIGGACGPIVAACRHLASN